MLTTGRAAAGTLPPTSQTLGNPIGPVSLALRPHVPLTDAHDHWEYTARFAYEIDTEHWRAAGRLVRW